MTKRYRLTARAEMFGAIRDPGFEFTLAPGELGPHTAVVASNHGAQITEHMGVEQKLVDMPLYVEVTDPVEPEEKPEVEISDEHAQDKAVIADLERQLADKDKQLGEAHAKLAAVDCVLKAAAVTSLDA